MELLVILGIAVVIAVFANLKSLSRENSQLKERLAKTQSELYSVKGELAQKTRENQELTATVKSLRTENNTLRQSLSEAPLGFPSLLEAIRRYDKHRDEHIFDWLRNKSHPAPTAAEIVKTETRKRRDAELEADTEQAASSREAPPQDNTEDIAGRYLSREEYDKLSSAQRNQLALDRFWNWNKSKRMIGRLYEQYIGWLYEREGWLVDYLGISEGLSDLGRDLICHKDNTTLIIQCKNWSKSKRIYEKHIFQLFGTAYEYMKNNPFEEVRAVFFTSTQLSELAHMFAKEFRIELHEGFELKRFPIIKCNVGREGERIYHLPFDQQYYSTKIKPTEAEARGFRRAYRWHGNREDF